MAACEMGRQEGVAGAGGVWHMGMKVRLSMWHRHEKWHASRRYAMVVAQGMEAGIVYVYTGAIYGIEGRRAQQSTGSAEQEKCIVKAWRKVRRVAWEAGMRQRRASRRRYRAARMAVPAARVCLYMVEQAG